MSRDKLSIIIVSWNTRDLLVQCLKSIYRTAQDLTPEIIIVDNASGDGTARTVSEQFPEVKLIANETNLGFAQANNQGVAQCTGRYILLLNPDTELTSGALQILMATVDARPEVGMAGARLLNSDGSLQISCYKAPTLTREFWRLFHLDKLYPHAIYRMETWSLDQPQEVDVLKGACLLLRREVFDQVGGFDEQYFMYSEEVDLCRKIRDAGWLLYWVPQARVVHHEGQSTRQIALPMFLQLYRGKLRYFRKHDGPLKAQLYKLILFLATLARLAVSPLAILESGNRREQHLELARQYWYLLRTLPEF